MGCKCSTECCGQEKNGSKKMKSEEENELLILSHRHHNNHTKLSIIAEDAYESQLSDQNSHVLQVQTSMANSSVPNNIKQWANFLIIHIREKVILSSSTNDSCHISAFSLSEEATTNQIILSEFQLQNHTIDQFINNISLQNLPSPFIGPAVTSTIINPIQVVNVNNNNNNVNILDALPPNSDRSLNGNNHTSSNINQIGNMNSSKLIKQTSKEDTSQSLNNAKYNVNNLIFPLENQVKQLYKCLNCSLHNKKTVSQPAEILDTYPFQDLLSKAIKTWSDLLNRSQSDLGIAPNSNLMIINNFLFICVHHSFFKSIAKVILSIIFDSLSCQRFILTPSAPSLLKTFNKKTGIVFDVTCCDVIFCFPVLDGNTIPSLSQVIDYNLLPTQSDSCSYCGTQHNSKPFQFYQNSHDQNQQSQESKYQSNNNNNDNEIPSNGQIFLEVRSLFDKQLECFLDSLDKDFLKQCFTTKSIILNNNSKKDSIQFSLSQVLKRSYSQFFDDNNQTKDNNGDNLIVLNTKPKKKESTKQQNNFKLLITQQPALDAMQGAIDLVRLNAIKTISKAKYEKDGVSEILKSTANL